MHLVAHYFILAVGCFSAQQLWHWEDVWKNWASHCVYQPTGGHQAGRPCARVHHPLCYGRDASALVMQRGVGGERLWHLYNGCINSVGSGTVALIFLDWKIRASLVFRARGNPNVSLPLNYIASSCWCRDINFVSYLLTYPVSYKKEEAGTFFTYDEDITSLRDVIWAMLAAVRTCCSHAWFWRMITALHGFKERFWRGGQLLHCKEHIGEEC